MQFMYVCILAASSLDRSFV